MLAQGSSSRCVGTGSLACLSVIVAMAACSPTADGNLNTSMTVSMATFAAGTGRWGPQLEVVASSGAALQRTAASETPSQALAGLPWDASVTIRAPIASEVGKWAVIIRFVVMDMLLIPDGGLSVGDAAGLAFAMKNSIRFLPPSMLRIRVTTNGGSQVVRLRPGSSSFPGWESVAGPNVLASLLLEDPDRVLTSGTLEAAVLLEDEESARQ